MSDNAAENEMEEVEVNLGPDPMVLGRRKAAIAMMVLGPELAQRVFTLLTGEQVERLLAEAEALENVEGEEVLEVLEELTADVDTRVAGVSGHNYILEEAARTALGDDKLRGILGLKPEATGPAALLREAAAADPDSFARIMSREHPQVITVVLTLLEAAEGAAVMDQFPPELKTEVIQRMATIRSIPGSVIAEVAEIVSRAMERSDEAGPVQIDGTGQAVSLLKAVGLETEEAIFQDLGSRDNELAEHLKSLMFVFEDIIKLHAREIQLILREIDSQALAIALAGSSTEVKESVLGNMSSRAAMIVLDEIEAMGPMPKSQIQEAQDGAVEIIMRLAEEGKVNTRPDAE